MTVRDLMAGYTAYTDAAELSAARGSRRDVLVTTTDPTTDTTATSFFGLAATGADGSGDAAGATILTAVPQVRETV
jgi:hypothetical protein